MAVSTVRCCMYNCLLGELPMKLINQINDYTCVHACIAMVTGADINELHEKYPYALPDDTAIKILVEHKVFPQYTTYPHLFPVQGLYLMTVPSLNKKACNHCVVVDASESGFVLYDPQTDREGKEWYPEDYLHNGLENTFSYSNVCFMNKAILL